MTQIEVKSAVERDFGHIYPKWSVISSEHVKVVTGSNDDDIAFNIVWSEVEEDNEDEDINIIVEDDTVVGGINLDHNVGFGNPSNSDVNDVLELSVNIESSSDIIKDMKDNCISQNSKYTYTYTLVLSILYVYISMTGIYFIKVG